MRDSTDFPVSYCRVVLLRTARLLSRSPLDGVLPQRLVCGEIVRPCIVAEREADDAGLRMFDDEDLRKSFAGLRACRFGEHFDRAGLRRRAAPCASRRTRAGSRSTGARPRGRGSARCEQVRREDRIGEKCTVILHLLVPEKIRVCSSSADHTACRRTSAARSVHA